MLLSDSSSDLAAQHMMNLGTVALQGYDRITVVTKKWTNLHYGETWCRLRWEYRFSLQECSKCSTLRTGSSCTSSSSSRDTIRYGSLLIGLLIFLVRRFRRPIGLMESAISLLNNLILDFVYFVVVFLHAMSSGENLENVE